jgi:hypothetical protein
MDFASNTVSFVNSGLALDDRELNRTRAVLLSRHFGQFVPAQPLLRRTRLTKARVVADDPQLPNCTVEVVQRFADDSHFGDDSFCVVRTGRRGCGWSETLRDFFARRYQCAGPIAYSASSSGYAVTAWSLRVCLPNSSW